MFALRGLDMSKIESRPMRSTIAGADGVSQPNESFRSAHIPEEMMKHNCMLTPESSVSVSWASIFHKLVILYIRRYFVYLQLLVSEVMKCHESRKPLEIFERAAWPQYLLICFPED